MLSALVIIGKNILTLENLVPLLLTVSSDLPLNIVLLKQWDKYFPFSQPSLATCTILLAIHTVLSKCFLWKPFQINELTLQKSSFPQHEVCPPCIMQFYIYKIFKLYICLLPYKKCNSLTPCYEATTFFINSTEQQPIISK